MSATFLFAKMAANHFYNISLSLSAFFYVFFMSLSSCDLGAGVPGFS